jgi:hypothetical protein
MRCRNFVHRSRTKQFAINFNPWSSKRRWSLLSRDEKKLFLHSSAEYLSALSKVFSIFSTPIEYGTTAVKPRPRPVDRSIDIEMTCEIVRLPYVTAYVRSECIYLSVNNVREDFVIVSQPFRQWISVCRQSEVRTVYTHAARNNEERRSIGRSVGLVGGEIDQTEQRWETHTTCTTQSTDCKKRAKWPYTRNISYHATTGASTVYRLAKNECWSLWACCSILDRPNGYCKQSL